MISFLALLPTSIIIVGNEINNQVKVFLNMKEPITDLIIETKRIEGLETRKRNRDANTNFDLKIQSEQYS